MNAKWLLPSLCLVLVAVGCGNPPAKSKIENCSNGVDDDENGFADCDDSACFGIGSCVTKIKECTSQADCLKKDGKAYPDYRVAEDPMPACVDYKCVKPETGLIDINFQVKTHPGYDGCCSSQGINAVNTRFIRPTAVDGSAVTCERLQQLAGGENASPTAIEDSKQFNLVAYDMSPASKIVGGESVLISPFHATTGSDFLIWTELWSNRNSLQKLPTGARYGWGCSAGEPAITKDDANVRTVTIVMPAAQNPLP